MLQRYNPCAGADDLAFVLSLLSKISTNWSILRLAVPILTNVPTIARTIPRKNLLAVI